MSDVPTLQDWVRFHGTFNPDPERHVEKVEFEVEANDAVSSTDGIDRNPVYFTDIQFQSGNVLTGWTPNTKEMMKQLTWTDDEKQNVASPNEFEGNEPTVYENVKKRWFNLMGRGNTTLVVPNYLPEDWEVPILPTGLDITLYPKEDFDLCRVCTEAGTKLPEEEWHYKDIIDEYREKEERGGGYAEYRNLQRVLSLFEDHPLHYRHTREMWFEGAEAGTEILVHANTRIARVGDNYLDLIQRKPLDLNGYTYPVQIEGNKFLIAPKGSTRFRVEFYKKKTLELITEDEDGNRVKKEYSYLEDVGVGFHGYASFFQWTYGREQY
ncbi:hypothetical protein CHL76_02250 [Marinococcus halophilus]|uniref:Uncharacterized protein n=1 Tax=Marinococcus halophilus TaxID=1371 RepID=A0A510Y2Q7_MARHA|nr:hypothetical protein [Marinococcus halophilus]OZT81198.1 hypothetical protein CHL76_02250 [Marinococcus halophilus]GEK57131.1 hypothetical protein MHA01_00360 [Marinococcus halophilus]